MAASVLKFEYKVMGQTREEVIETIDQLVLDTVTKEGGEPWVNVNEEYVKQAIDQELAIAGDPRGFIWVGAVTVLFAGPTKFVGVEPQFRDGFRPQADDGDLH